MQSCAHPCKDSQPLVLLRLPFLTDAMAKDKISRATYFQGHRECLQLMGAASCSALCRGAGAQHGRFCIEATSDKAIAPLW